eukprot:7423206-Heterocapsa_arctica.AAC.1
MVAVPGESTVLFLATSRAKMCPVVVPMSSVLVGSNIIPGVIALPTGIISSVMIHQSLLVVRVSL